ncbi:MAG: putative CRISPR-associated protein [Chloroflexi bacterium]|nr:putative CRISPR-associated protein [Chloroflexota bacterium]
MRNCLISTVGTSIITNISGQYRGEKDSGVSQEMHEKLKRFLNERNWGQLARVLASVEPTARICGAEINSVAEIVRRQRIDLRHIHLLVSDTDEGQNVGKLLESYFIERTNRDLPNLQTVEYHTVAGLQDREPARFRALGLRNLVREIGNLVKRYDRSNVLIDATGGYKAQIAIAVVFGQALEIPVMYRHERFPEIIAIPPMPIAFDYALLGENADVLAFFERGAAVSSAELPEMDERLRVLLEEVEVDSETLFELSAVGQIYLTGFRLRFPRSAALAEVAPSEKRPPSFGDHHYPIGFKAFVEKVCAEVGWIKTAHTVPYDRQRSIKGTAFYVSGNRLIGTYQDRNNFGARFEILTNASTPDQLAWAADQLNQFYGKDDL